VAIIVALFAITAMILLAFVVDRGRIYVKQTQLQNAVDAAALAAAQDICMGAGYDPPERAKEYAVSNGVASRANVTVSPDPWVETSAEGTVNVRASETLPMAFGAFVNVPAVTVATQATVQRTCIVFYNIVAKRTVVFSGTNQTGGSIYAGECFRAQDSNGNPSNAGSVSFERVVVSSPRTLADGTPAGQALCGTSVGTFPIDPEDVVDEPVYNEVLDFDGLAATVAGPLITAVQDNGSRWVGECKDVPVQDSQEPWVSGLDIECTGGATITIPSVSYSGSIVADGRIDMSGSTVLTGANQLIYTSFTTDQNQSAISYQGNIGPGVTLYAPNGQVRQASATVTFDGRILADEIEFKGAGSQVATGIPVRDPQTPKLIQ
jgi:Flp pilus assembly protein TadG